MLTLVRQAGYWNRESESRASEAERLAGRSEGARAPTGIPLWSEAGWRDRDTPRRVESVRLARCGREWNTCRTGP